MAAQAQEKAGHHLPGTLVIWVGGVEREHPLLNPNRLLFY